MKPSHCHIIFTF